MILRYNLILLTSATFICSLQNQLISSPFDNFRIECAKSSGAIRISVRMVGSQGFLRQDIVFAIVCERVDELYPWYGIPMGIAEVEREDCYYSELFDPVVDTDSLYTCRTREYISGITRLSDTRVQVLCCRLRTREETNCEEKQFSKPIGSDPRTEIYHNNKLINSIAVEGHTYRVRFCDLTPRAVGLIFEDIQTTTVRTTTTKTKIHEESTGSKIVTSTIAETRSKKKAYRKNGHRKTTRTTEAPATKRVIKIFRPSALYNFGEEDQRTWDMNTLPPARNNYRKGEQPYTQEAARSENDEKFAVVTATTPMQRAVPAIPPDLERDYAVDDQGLLTEIDTLLEAQQTSGKEHLALVDRLTDNVYLNTTRKPENTSKQNQAPFTSTNLVQERRGTSSSSGQQMQDHHLPEVVDNSMFRTSTVPTVSNATVSQRTTAPPSLILLKPLTSKLKYTGVTLSAKLLQRTTPSINIADRLDQEITSTSTAVLSTTAYTALKGPVIKISQATQASFGSRQADGTSSKAAYIDEETNYSPFENEDSSHSQEIEAFAANDPTDISQAAVNVGLPYKVSNEIRRAPIKPPRKQIDAAYSETKNFANKHTNKLENEFNFPTFGDEITEGNGADYAENDFLIKKSADGSRTYEPHDQEPIKAPAPAEVYSSSNKHHSSGSYAKSVGDEQRATRSSGQQNDLEEKSEANSWTADVEEEVLPMNAHEVDWVAADTKPPSSVTSGTTSSTPVQHEQTEFSSTNFSQHQAIEADKSTNFETEIEKSYDPAKFYHTPPPKRPPPTEKVLTFCTKEIAIRDKHNLVIACGSETEIWKPYRCPPGSECFLSTDSSYRICCAVAESVQYAQ